MTVDSFRRRFHSKEYKLIVFVRYILIFDPFDKAMYFVSFRHNHEPCFRFSEEGPAVQLVDNLRWSHFIWISSHVLLLALSLIIVLIVCFKRFNEMGSWPLYITQLNRKVA